MAGHLQNPLLNDWPVHERVRSLELGCVIDCRSSRLIELAATDVLGRNSAGWWRCNLADNSLIWTAGIYRIFGIPDGVHVARGEAVALYSEESRVRMERLRSYAIATGSGFALDAEIRPADGSSVRWMRLIGTPVLENGRVCQLEGLKLLL